MVRRPGTLILALLGAAACAGKSDKRADAAPDTSVPALATIVQAPPAGGTFVGEEGSDPRSEGRPEATVRAGGTAQWSYELDSLDLRRKVTIRIALNTPESTYVVLRALDDAPPAPGLYGTLLPATGVSHHDPHLFHADIHSTEVGRQRNYLLGSLNKDSVFIDPAPDGAPHDSTLRGRIRLRGSRFADQKGNEVLRDYVMHDVFGSFVAPQSMAAGPSVVVTPQMQEMTLRRALDGFMTTNMGAINGDGGMDSTMTSPLARRYLEARWGAAAVVDSLVASGRSYFIRLRGRFVPTMCEVDSRDTRILCRYAQTG